MKSAYQLAMERLEKSSPSMKLSEGKKRELADIESTYKARIAEGIVTAWRNQEGYSRWASRGG